MRVFLSRQFSIFLVTGGTAAAVNFFSRIIFSQWVSFSVAIILAYLCGMITAFVLAKCFVFKGSQQSLTHSIFYFCLVNVMAIMQTWIISMTFAFYILPLLNIKHYSHEIAHAIGIIVPVFTSYLGHKHLSFRDVRK